MDIADAKEKYDFSKYMLYVTPDTERVERKKDWRRVVTGVESRKRKHSSYLQPNTRCGLCPLNPGAVDYRKVDLPSQKYSRKVQLARDSHTQKKTHQWREAVSDRRATPFCSLERPVLVVMEQWYVQHRKFAVKHYFKSNESVIIVQLYSFPLLYNRPRPINKGKLRDVLALLKYTPSVHHDYYRSLVPEHEDSKNTKVEE
ncbi:hypothetical protein J6590_079131 [Homalodisca vitripennis]|nr:hypothetical protein J6590_079131 [Homalodisca vitripennis]